MFKRIIFSFRYLLLVVFLVLFYRAWHLSPKVSFEPFIPISVTVKEPVHMSFHPENSSQVFVSQKFGQLLFFDKKSGKSHTALDLTDVIHQGHLEAGLLSTAFDPNFETNQFLYVFYSATDPARGRVSRFTMGEDSKLNRDSELIIFEWNKLMEHHYGGQLLFQDDKNLLISIGEDYLHSPKEKEFKRGKTFRGSVIRIDVSESSKTQPYKIPADNPFVDDPERPDEVWVYGFRNPWRMQYDPTLKAIVLGDTGNSEREEFNTLKAGGDYGWPEFEGELCNQPPCEDSGELAATLTLTHDVIRTPIPGIVYQGDSIPWLKGQFVLADYLRGLFSVDLESAPAIFTTATTNPFGNPIKPLYFKMPVRSGEKHGDKNALVSIHAGPDNELHVVDLNSTVYKMIPLSFSDRFWGYFYHLVKF